MRSSFRSLITLPVLCMVLFTSLGPQHVLAQSVARGDSMRARLIVCERQNNQEVHYEQRER